MLLPAVEELLSLFRVSGGQLSIDEFVLRDVIVGGLVGSQL